MKVLSRWNLIWQRILFSLCILCIHQGKSSASAPELQRLAVLELKSFGVLELPQLMRLSDKLRAEAQQTLGEDFMIITREHISVLLEDPTVSEACTSNCEIKVGRAIQAHYVLSGLIMSSGDELSGTLKLHRVRDNKLIGIEEASGSDEDTLAQSLKTAVARLTLRISSAVGDGGAGIVAQSQLNVDSLPPLKELTVINRFGIPTQLLLQYEEALKVDEDEDEPIERKVEVWSKLSVYTKYDRLSDQAKGRLAYWKQRYKRRLACDQMWQDLSPVMSLSRAVSKEERSRLAVDFLNECGRDPRENPHVKHPALKRQIEREEKKKREAEEEVERKERAQRRKAFKAEQARKEAIEKDKELALKKEQKKNKLIDELSPLELWIGVSHGVKAEGISYHLKTRLQLEDVLKRALFLELFSVLIQTPNQVGEVLENEIGGGLGYQWLNSSQWVPSVSIGYTRLSGHSYGLGELGLRYIYIPGWLDFGLSFQYIKGFNLEQTQAELDREADPKGPLNPVRAYLPNLNTLNGELRLTIWADTGIKGVIVGGLVLYLLSTLGS